MMKAGPALAAGLLTAMLAACTGPSPADVQLRNAELQQSISADFGSDTHRYTPVRGSDALLVADITVTVTNEGDSLITVTTPISAFALRDAQGQSITAEGIIEADGTGCVNCSDSFSPRWTVEAHQTTSSDYTVVFLFPEAKASDSLWLQYAENEPIPVDLVRAFTAATSPAIPVPFCEAQIASGEMAAESYLCLQGAEGERLTEGQNRMQQLPEAAFATGCSYHMNGFCLISEEWAVGFLPDLQTQVSGNNAVVMIDGLPADRQFPTTLSGGVFQFDGIGDRETPDVILARRVLGNWNQCRGTGQFEVREMEVDPVTHEYVRFAATFELRCAGSDEPVRGMLRWVRSEITAAPSDSTTLPF